MYHNYGCEELFGRFALGTEALGLQSHVFLGLRVERGIDNQTVNKYPQMIFNLMGFDADAALVLLL